MNNSIVFHFHRALNRAVSSQFGNKIWKAAFNEAFSFVLQVLSISNIWNYNPYWGYSNKSLNLYKKNHDKGVWFICIFTVGEIKFSLLSEIGGRI